MGKAIFITGTGTDVGKTYVTALVVKKLRASGWNAGYYKAAISGAEPGADGELVPGDAVYVNREAHIGESVDNLVSYVYREAVSPHLAARLNRRDIDLDWVEKQYRRALDKYEYLTVEGSGGIICPLTWTEERHVILDELVQRLRLGVVVVAEAGLGTINATALTVEHLVGKGIPVKGVILNRYVSGALMHEDNAAMIRALTRLPILATVAEGDRELDIDVDRLRGLYA